MKAAPRSLRQRTNVSAPVSAPVSAWGWRPAILGLAAVIWLAPAAADEFRDLTLEQALQRLERQGLAILYSSDLVQPSMRVRDEPRATGTRAILEEILKPHGLTVRDGPNGLLMLVRAADAALPADGAPEADGSERIFHIPPPQLEEVIVSASQYQLVRELTVPVAWLSAADLQLLPDLGDDPARAVQRLPGTAGSELSAKVNVRGGEADETLVRFDDLRLHNPFHLKDFQSTFSTIGSGVVDGMQVWSGGFPVTFGDRMSSVIDIEPLSPDSAAYRELSLSSFNASALASGQSRDKKGEWLLSGRRGNLDLLVDAVNSSIGEPSYLDFYARAGRQVADSLRISANALVSDDSIVLFDSDQEEEARAEYRDAYYWLRFDYQPSPAFTANVLLAHGDLDSDRQGRADQDGIARGTLNDERSFNMDSIQTDASWRIRRNMLLQFGGEWRAMRGSYDYRDEVEFDLLFDVPGAFTEPVRARRMSLRPHSDHFAAYANLRIEPLEALTADVGLRWDRDTLSPGGDAHSSPRLGLLYSLGERTRLRASWGRFFQAQAINELQISDGETRFFPPQRADHLIASIEHEYDNGVSLRLEAYRKDYRQVRARFENLLNTFVLLPELKPDRIRIAPDRATAKGAELTVRADANESLSWWLSYSWSSVKDEIGGHSTLRSWDQTHLLQGGLAWRSDRWELSLVGTYHTGWPTSEVVLTQTEPIPIATAGLRNGRRLGDYRSLDARVARLWDLEGAGDLTVFVELNNLLNRTNDCCTEYEMEDEEGELGLDISTRPYLPIIPSLGFVWHF